DRELVAAVAGDDVDPARLFHEDLGDLAQGLVADRVAELVVDALEAVEIEEHDRHGVVEAPEAGDLLLEAQGEEAPVVEPGHVVTERGLLELGVGDLELLVRGVEARGEGVDLDRLRLDRGEHAGERLHERTDLVGPGAGRRGVRLRRQQLPHAADGPAYVPDDPGDVRRPGRRGGHEELDGPNGPRAPGDRQEWHGLPLFRPQDPVAAAPAPPSHASTWTTPGSLLSTPASSRSCDRSWREASATPARPTPLASRRAPRSTARARRSRGSSA